MEDVPGPAAEPAAVPAVPDSPGPLSPDHAEAQRQYGTQALLSFPWEVNGGVRCSAPSPFDVVRRLRRRFLGVQDQQPRHGDGACSRYGAGCSDRATRPCLGISSSTRPSRSPSRMCGRSRGGSGGASGVVAARLGSMPGLVAGGAGLAWGRCRCSSRPTHRGCRARGAG